MNSTQTENQTETKLLPPFKVIIHNDDHNSMEHVIFCLIDVFSFEEEQAIVIMLEAHQTGAALCKVEPKEHAEFHAEQLQSYGITATIEPDN